MIPDITELDLSDYAARALADAAAMYVAAKEHAETTEDVVNVLTASMSECFARGRRIIEEYDPMMGARNQAIIAENMHVCIRTIAAASLALVPIYETLESYWRAESRQQN